MRVHLTPRRRVLEELPRSVIEDREYTLRRVLSDFPDPLLAALISGLELHGGRLRSGTLFASYRDSCACGAMIRQLNPAEFECGHWKFLIRHRWRRRAASYGGTLQTDMHVAWMEKIFDRAVYLTLKRRKDVSARTAARAAGRWMLSEAEQELGRRYARIEAGLPAIDSWRDLPLRRWGEGLEQRFAGLAGTPV